MYNAGFMNVPGLLTCVPFCNWLCLCVPYALCPMPCALCPMSTAPTTTTTHHHQHHPPPPPPTTTTPKVVPLWWRCWWQRWQFLMLIVMSMQFSPGDPSRPPWRLPLLYTGSRPQARGSKGSWRLPRRQARLSFR